MARHRWRRWAADEDVRASDEEVKLVEGNVREATDMNNALSGQISSTACTPITTLPSPPTT